MEAGRSRVVEDAAKVARRANASAVDVIDFDVGHQSILRNGGVAMVEEGHAIRIGEDAVGVPFNPRVLFPRESASLRNEGGRARVGTNDAAIVHPHFAESAGLVGDCYDDTHVI